MDIVKFLNKDKMIKNKGFTLIEMAIVLVIIGLIIGVAVTGKDLMNSAKQKSVYTKFIQPWTLAVVSYYDRTGQLLGDGEDNGGTEDDPDGKFDEVDGSDTGEYLTGVGLTVPSSNTGTSSEYSYTGAYSGTATITLTLSNVSGNNVFYLDSVPTDLAIALDTIVDGVSDGKTGSFVDSANSDWSDAEDTTTETCMLILDIP